MGCLGVFLGYFGVSVVKSMAFVIVRFGSLLVGVSLGFAARWFPGGGFGAVPRSPNSDGCDVQPAETSREAGPPEQERGGLFARSRRSGSSAGLVQKQRLADVLDLGYGAFQVERL